MKKLSIALAVAFVLVGCASDPVEKYAKQQEALKDIAVEEAKAKLDSAPDWYIAPPKNDGYGLVGVGAASSKDMHLAVKRRVYRLSLSWPRIIDKSSLAQNVLMSVKTRLVI